MGYKWPTRSVERLPPFRHQKLRNKILVMGNTVDPVTSIANARFVVELLGDQAVLVEQLGFGHTTLAGSSNCTDEIVADHILRGIVSLSCLGIRMGSLNHRRGSSSHTRRRPSANSTVRSVDCLLCSWKTITRSHNLWFSAHETSGENVTSLQCFLHAFSLPVFTMLFSNPPKHNRIAETKTTCYNITCTINNFSTF